MSNLPFECEVTARWSVAHLRRDRYIPFRAVQHNGVLLVISEQVLYKST